MDPVTLKLLSGEAMIYPKRPTCTCMLPVQNQEERGWNKIATGKGKNRAKNVATTRRKRATSNAHQSTVREPADLFPISQLL